MSHYFNMGLKSYCSFGNAIALMPILWFLRSLSFPLKNSLSLFTTVPIYFVVTIHRICLKAEFARAAYIFSCLFFLKIRSNFSLCWLSLSLNFVIIFCHIIVEHTLFLMGISDSNEFLLVLLTNGHKIFSWSHHSLWRCVKIFLWHIHSNILLKNDCFIEMNLNNLSTFSLLFFSLISWLN